MESKRSLIAPAALLLVLFALFLSGLSLARRGNARTAPTPTPTKTPTPPPPLTTATPLTRRSAAIVPATAVETATQAAPATPTSTATTARPTATLTATPRQPKATPTATSLSDDMPGRDIVESHHTPTPTLVPQQASAAGMNPLTGLMVPSWKLNRRPLGIKIPNFPPEARPQSGLSRADVVIEHEAEAYLTRFTAIFMGGDAYPVGPLRSVRLIDGDLMSIFRSTLVASGGHPAVKLRATQGKAWAAGYKRIICPEPPFLGDGGTMRRIPKAGRRYELTLYSDTASLWNLSAQRAINGKQDFGGMWVFDESPPPGGRDATHLKIIYKPTYSEAEYRYDPGSRTYRRFDVGQPTIDELTGLQIAPPNVLVLYANHANSDIAADTHDPNNIWYSVIIQLWGSGPGKLLRDGKVYDVRWVRETPQQTSDLLVFIDDTGSKVPLHPGTTWIQLVRLDASVQID